MQNIQQCSCSVTRPIQQCSVSRRYNSAVYRDWWPLVTFFISPPPDPSLHPLSALLPFAFRKCSLPIVIVQDLTLLICCFFPFRKCSLPIFIAQDLILNTFDLLLFAFRKCSLPIVIVQVLLSLSASKDEESRMLFIVRRRGIVERWRECSALCIFDSVLIYLHLHLCICIFVLLAE